MSKKDKSEAPEKGEKEDKAAKKAAKKEQAEAKAKAKVDAKRAAKASAIAKRKAKRGDSASKPWRKLDSAVAAVLVANILLLAAVVAWPSSGSDPEQSSTTASGDPERKGQKPSFSFEDDEVKPEKRGAEGVDTSKIPLLPRNELWQKSQRDAAEGRIGSAIVSLQRLLREEPMLGEVPRRAVWLQLSYLAGIDGREEDAARWLRLSKASLEIGLVPTELLRLAREAAGARDWAESRRYGARYLLQQGQLGEAAPRKIAAAYMLLGDSYRDQAGVASPGSSSGESAANATTKDAKK